MALCGDYLTITFAGALLRESSGAVFRKYFKNYLFQENIWLIISYYKKPSNRTLNNCVKDVFDDLAAEEDNCESQDEC